MFEEAIYSKEKESLNAGHYSRIESSAILSNHLLACKQHSNLLTKNAF
jgi:hypothetical protein